MLPAGTPPQTVGQVMDAAIVMTVAASSSGDEGFRWSTTCTSSPASR
jgi:hypothetical protein